jgi:hypothetical protein
LGGLGFFCALGCTGIVDGESPLDSGHGGPLPTPGTAGGNGTSGAGGGGGSGSGPSLPEVGVVTLRRLNRDAYANTLRSLTGATEDFAAKFPPDNLSLGFDNIGDGLTIQPLHVEVFEQCADVALTSLFARPESDAFRKQVLACDPLAAGHACISSTVVALAERAFRRPVVESELARYLAIADKFVATGGTGTDALKLALKAVLVSPRFLFRIELDASPTDATPHHLTDYELASRLSYYLWSTMPDDALFAAAKAGALSSDAGLREQVSRMLSDPKADQLISSFSGQWLNLRRLDNSKPDSTMFPKYYDDALALAMQTESRLFFTDIFKRGRPLVELLTSNSTYLNANLASFYGLPVPSGEGFQRVSLASDQNHRVGFLSQGAFLTLTSNPTNTSPVKRGHWVLEQLLCEPPPPPPDSVSTKVPVIPGSARVRLASHRTRPFCNTCHGVMDPVGLSFEHFDAVGQFRVMDTNEFGSFPIDAQGVITTGAGDQAFEGPAELIPILAKDPRLLPCVAQKILTYAVGRKFTAEDRDAIQKTLTTANADNQGLRSLFVSAALGESFRSRRAVGE